MPSSNLRNNVLDLQQHLGLNLIKRKEMNYGSFNKSYENGD